VPKDKEVLYPLINIAGFNVPADPSPAPFKVEEKRGIFDHLWSDVPDPVFGINAGLVICLASWTDSRPYAM
jgi:hypothetical protein